MEFTKSQHPDADVLAIEDALSRIGEPITEALANAAALEGCECKEGMFALAATRRQLFAGTGLVAAVEYPVPADSTKEPGRVMGEDGGYGSRSQFESEIRWVNPTRTASWVPMQNSYGTITPSGLHYERHHAGIPNLDPARHRLVIHGLV